VGKLLQNSPSSLVFEKESSDGRFPTEYIVREFDRKDLNIERVHALVNDYQELVIEKQEFDRAQAPKLTYCRYQYPREDMQGEPTATGSEA
jgi:hypothetical protein